MCTQQTTLASSCRPSKESVRQWLAMRCRTHTPLPDLDEIRRHLWGGPPAGAHGAGGTAATKALS